jgi:hypothetical protein
VHNISKEKLMIGFPAINNRVVTVLVASNIIYISSSIRRFANENKHNPETALSGATTFAPKPWFWK